MISYINPLTVLKQKFRGSVFLRANQKETTLLEIPIVSAFQKSGGNDFRLIPKLKGIKNCFRQQH